MLRLLPMTIMMTMMMTTVQIIVMILITMAGARHDRADDADRIPKQFPKYFHTHASAAFGIEDVPTRSPHEFLRSYSLTKCHLTKL